MMTQAFHRRRFLRWLGDFSVSPPSLVAAADGSAIADEGSGRSLLVQPANITEAEGIASAIKLAAAAEALVAKAQAAVEAVRQDDSGMLVGGEWRGGHGGLLSRDTIRTIDALQHELSGWGKI